MNLISKTMNQDMVVVSSEMNQDMNLSSEIVLGELSELSEEELGEMWGGISGEVDLGERLTFNSNGISGDSYADYDEIRLKFKPNLRADHGGGATLAIES